MREKRTEFYSRQISLVYFSFWGQEGKVIQ